MSKTFSSARRDMQIGILGFRAPFEVYKDCYADRQTKRNKQLFAVTREVSYSLARHVPVSTYVRPRGGKRVFR